MKNNFIMKHRIFFILVIIFVLFASYSSSYITGDESNNFRVRKFEEIQSHSSNYGDTGSIQTGTYSQNLICIQEFDGLMTKIVLFFSKKMLILFFILTVILSFYQFYLYIRSWMIQISQSKNRIFMVHYLKLKDGKKDAQSLYSL